MREIKFRGKRIDTGEWVYGDYVRRVISGNTLHNITATNTYDLIPIDLNTIGQYVTLNDILGKEIFDGDIVEYDVRSQNGKRTVRLVVFDNGSFRLKKGKNKPTRQGHLFAQMIHTSNLTVIGNIHDAPELLKHFK